MNCDLEFQGDTLVCKRCKVAWGVLGPHHLQAINGDLSRIVRACPALPATTWVPYTPPEAGMIGPGTFLIMLIQMLDVTPTDCDCAMRASLMNGWGIEGCEKHMGEIVGWLRVEFKRLGWINRLKVRKNAVLNGMVFYINAVNPVPSLVKESIRLAKEYRETHKR